jgi:FKBP-type peptidyl-prolyl cis-trans isomerase (trigger factor)
MPKKKELSSPHASSSFAQLVSKAQLEALKPYIEQVADQKMAELANKIISTLYQVVMNNQAQTQIRQLAFEKLLKEHTKWLTDDALAMATADIEDGALGLESIKTPAAEGDKVRVEVKYSTQPEAAPEKVLINALLQTSPQGQVQTLLEVEQALVGLAVGESTTVTLPSQVPGVDGTAEQTSVEITVKRVSRKKGS